MGSSSCSGKAHRHAYPKSLLDVSMCLPILNYGKSSKVHNMMANFWDILDFLYACKIVDRKILIGSLQEYESCFVFWSWVPCSGKKRVEKRSGKRHDWYFLGKPSQKICIPGSPSSCYTANATYIFSTWTFRKITYIKTTQLFVSYIRHI
jgi:hypothetical protein